MEKGLDCLMYLVYNIFFIMEYLNERTHVVGREVSP
jgi:hypothetical protein